MKNRLLILALTLASLFATLPARAEVQYGDLVKGSGPTVFYVTPDLKRLAFADEQAFRTWYPDFSSVRPISDAELNAMPLVGIAPFRPGIRPIQGATEARVYGIDRDGKLRWLATADVARMIFGSDWTDKIAVVPDTVLADYGRGADVTGPGQYWWMKERDASPNLQEMNARRISSVVAMRPIPAPAATFAVAPAKPAKTQVIIIPKMINDDGGSGMEGDTDYFLGAAKVLPQDGINVLPGTYTVYHGEYPGYTISAWGLDCTPDGVVTVEAGQTRVCTITFNDIADDLYGTRANRPPSLTLYAHDDGPATGLQDEALKMFVGSDPVATGRPYTYAPGDYTLYRVVPAGYRATVWSGDCTAIGTVSLRNGDDKTCFISFRK